MALRFVKVLREPVRVCHAVGGLRLRPVPSAPPVCCGASQQLPPMSRFSLAPRVPERPIVIDSLTVAVALALGIAVA